MTGHRGWQSRDFVRVRNWPARVHRVQGQWFCEGCSDSPPGFGSGDRRSLLRAYLHQEVMHGRLKPTDPCRRVRRACTYCLDLHDRRLRADEWVGGAGPVAATASLQKRRAKIVNHGIGHVRGVKPPSFARGCLLGDRKTEWEDILLFERSRCWPGNTALADRL